MGPLPFDRPVPRLLHTADWQIGKPYRWIEDLDRRSRLQRARLDAIERMVAVAASEAVDLVLVAGDLFDSSTVAEAVVMEVLEVIGTFPAPVLVIPGNHDHGGAGGIWRRADVIQEMRRRADNLHLLLTPEPISAAGVTVLPCPLLRQHETRSPGAWIETLDWNTLNPSDARVVLAHGSVQGFSATDYDTPGEQGANQLRPERWPTTNYDYLALGDWHAMKRVDPKGWYPGTPEPDRFPASPDDRRGQVLLVDVDRGLDPKVTVAETAGIQWHNEQVALRGGDDLQQLRQQVQILTGRRVGKDLLRLELEGQLGLADHRDLDALITDLQTRLLHLRVRGSCHRRPEASELGALLDRSDAPLMATIVRQLQTELLETDADQTDQIALLEAALCELHRLCQAAADASVTSVEASP